MPSSDYDRFPAVTVHGDGGAWRGWDDVLMRLRAEIDRVLSRQPRVVVAVECYPGVHDEEVAGALRRGLGADHWLSAEEAFLPPDRIDRMLEPYLGGDDPLFGFLAPLGLEAFLDPDRRTALRRHVAGLSGVVVIYGTGALLCAEPDLVIYADMPRWEGQLRQRRGEVSSLGVRNRGEKASLQYKRSFFVDWRVCDRLKKATLGRWDFLLDTTVPGDPRLVTGDALRAGLEQTARRPFRVVPFFDPAPWGGQWMKDVCGLDRDAVNYGWSFDCVPEENSLRLRFGAIEIEIPSLDLVFHQPHALLGDAVYGLFGPEFPIRFDLLDTMGGGNLSLQVHPPVDYAQEKFGLHYTQDESYYLLDAGAGGVGLFGSEAARRPRPAVRGAGRRAGGRRAVPRRRLSSAAGPRRSTTTS